LLCDAVWMRPKMRASRYPAAMSDGEAGPAADGTHDEDATEPLSQTDDSGDDGADDAEDEGRYDAPPLPPLLILAVVGLLCGFAMVSLVWLSEQGCARLRDTPDCGALGLPLLILTVALTIVLGAIALGWLALPQPLLVAFLGVMFLLLIVVGLLSDRLYSTWTLVVVPGLSAVTFAVAHLVAGRLERADA
jgi:hypothetical protein